MIDRTTLLLIAALCLLLSSTEECFGRRFDRRPNTAAGSGAVASDKSSSIETGPSVSPAESSVLDDEVEAPDESEDEEPDDPGDAIPQKGGLSFLLLALLDTDLEWVTSTGRVQAPVAAAPSAAQPRFLCLCRILR